MSMAQPLQPNLHPDRDTVPGADLGVGAPEPSPGFGIGGEAPDAADDAGEGAHVPGSDEPDDIRARPDQG
jgi:hypothetical protein